MILKKAQLKVESKCLSKRSAVLWFENEVAIKDAKVTGSAKLSNYCLIMSIQTISKELKD